MDEINPTLAPVATPEPAQAAPAVAPVTAPTEAPQAVAPAPAPTPAPAETPAPAVVPEAVAPVVEPKVEPAPEAKTIMGAELDKKPVETPKVETPAPELAQADPEPKVTEGGQSDEPAPPPKYEAFKLPEGVTLDEKKVGNFTNLLADLEVKGKVPHELSQEFGQKLVDYYVNEVKEALDTQQKSFADAWENQKVQWKDEFLKDPEIGGNRWQTTVDSALTFIRTHGGTPEQQAEFRNLMESSGLGNHPVMIRLLANAGRAMGEGRILAATRPVAPPKSKVSTMYGKN